MPETDAPLASYPKGAARPVEARSIANKLIASERGREFYDGKRENGYGGYIDDGRWLPVAQDFARIYGLTADSVVVQVGADKGFLLEAFHTIGIHAEGTEVSRYAINQATVRIWEAAPTLLPFDTDSVDLVIALGTVYTLTLRDAVRCLREIQRVSRGNAFVTLAAHMTAWDYVKLRKWSLLGNLIMTPDEWLQVMEYAGYTGDYSFVTAAKLGLQ